MAKPLVAIVGRPNVGKSTFFNKMAGKRLSIVDDCPGVTRDRIYADTEWCGKQFTIVDTGGIEMSSTDKMFSYIRRQVEMAVDLANVIIFFVDAKSGLMPDDYAVADYLRTSKKPVVLAVNKVDNPKKDPVIAYDFYELGIGEPIPVSCEQSLNLGDLLDVVISYLPDNSEEDLDKDVLKIAVVGKPNAGKSMLVNKILGQERTIVSDVAGTTRDAIDTYFDYENKKCCIIDTAGIRKKSKVEEDVEYYSVVRSIEAIRRSDVVAIVIDASVGITEQDVKICGMVHDARKPSIIVMNKWDLVEKDSYTINTFNNKLDAELKFMSYYKAIYISAKTGQRSNVVMPSLLQVYENASKRVATGILNDVLTDAMIVNEPPSYKGKKLKVYYSTQANTNPPTFIMFVNDETLVHFSYKRYIENSIRKAFDFSGTPITIRIRNKDEEDI
ncbi:MAG: ribosome biogenesis GTPase Der [Clostridia bacterium]|nr:ribosome biogenesis GTPase Der [Clostridia bacterium]